MVSLIGEAESQLAQNSSAKLNGQNLLIQATVAARHVNIGTKV